MATVPFSAGRAARPAALQLAPARTSAAAQRTGAGSCGVCTARRAVRRVDHLPHPVLVGRRVAAAVAQQRHGHARDAGQEDLVEGLLQRVQAGHAQDRVDVPVEDDPHHGRRALGDHHPVALLLAHARRPVRLQAPQSRQSRPSCVVLGRAGVGVAQAMRQQQQPAIGRERPPPAPARRPWPGRPSSSRRRPRAGPARPATPGLGPPSRGGPAAPSGPSSAPSPRPDGAVARGPRPRQGTAFRWAVSAAAVGGSGADGRPKRDSLGCRGDGAKAKLKSRRALCGVPIAAAGSAAGPKRQRPTDTSSHNTRAGRSKDRSATAVAGRRPGLPRPATANRSPMRPDSGLVAPCQEGLDGHGRLLDA